MEPNLEPKSTPIPPNPSVQTPIAPAMMVPNFGAMPTGSASLANLKKSQFKSQFQSPQPTISQSSISQPLTTPIASPITPLTPRAPANVIRTFQNDVAQSVDRKHVSTLTVALAENMRKNGDKGGTIGNEPEHQYGKKILLTIISLILVGAGSYGGYYLYLKSPLAPSNNIVPEKHTILSLVTPESQKIVDVTILKTSELVKVIRTATAEKIPAGSMHELVFTSKSNDKVPVISQMSGQSMISRLGFTAPDMLIRSMGPRSMFGIFADAKNEPFIILTNTFFQNAYAGMLKWESSIVDDAAPIFNYPPTPAQTGTSTIKSYFGIHGIFSDGVIHNKDVRIFKDDYGQILLLYSFIEKNTLVITTNENTFKEIVNKIEKQTYVR